MGARVWGVLFDNCGSVGKPKGRDPRAAFAILTTFEVDTQVTIVRVEYPATDVAGQVEAAGLPDELADKLLAAA